VGVKSTGTLEATGDTTLGANLTLGGATVGGIKDEDAMTSDSPTHLATQQSIKAYVDGKTHLALGTTSSTALAGDTTTISAGQASAITSNTAKTGITAGQATEITANTAKTGITSGQASAITANTAKTGITAGQASAITANTAKTGITSGQASEITANTAKTGITAGQASAITANTAKATNATHTGEVTGSGALTLSDDIVDEANLKGVGTATNDHVLTADSTATGGMKWAASSGAPEGTAVLSTGEAGATKFLREDGDGTSSWQVPSGSGTVTGTGADNQVAVWDSVSGIEGTSSLVFDGTSLGIGVATPKRHLQIYNPTDSGGGVGSSTYLQLTNLSTGSVSDADGFQLGLSNTGVAQVNQRENLGMVFSTNNTERLRIDSSGLCGIGRTPTVNRLEVEGAVSATDRGIFGGHSALYGSTAQLEMHRANNTYIAGFDTRTGAVNNGGYIRWFVKGGDGNYDTIGTVGATCTTAHATLPGGALVFKTAEAGSAEAEKMRIDSSGNVGIGTDSPAFNGLHVVSPGNSTYVGIQSDSGSSAQLKLYNTAGAFGWITESDTMYAYDYNDGRQIITFDGAGLVGIGTAAPTSPLHTAGTTNDGSSLVQLFQSGTGRAIHVSRNVAAATRQMASFTQLSTTGGTTAVVHIQQADTGETALAISTDGSTENFTVSDVGDVYAAGNVGIGTAVPTGNLNISSGARVSPNAPNGNADELVLEGTSTGVGMSILNDGDSNSYTGHIVFGRSGNAREGFIQYTHSDDLFQVGTRGTIRTTVDGSGNFGIGTAAPTEILTLNSASNTKLLLQEGGANKGTISAGGGGLYITNLAGKINFRNSSDAATLEIEDSGRVTVKKASNAEVTALTSSSASTAVDMDAANNFSLALAENTTLAQPTNITAGQSGAIVITQDATGSRTMAYNAYWKFEGGTAPVLSTTGGQADTLAYYVESTTSIHAVLLKNMS
jgi:hypothetical protein